MAVTGQSGLLTPPGSLPAMASLAVCVLDDYQSVAGACADWASLGDDVSVTFYRRVVLPLLRTTRGPVPGEVCWHRPLALRRAQRPR